MSKWSKKLLECKQQYNTLQVDAEFCLFLEILEKHYVKSLLEIGCWEGGTAKMFTELGIDVLGVDIKLQDKLKALARERPRKLTLIEGDSQLPSTESKVSAEAHGGLFDALFIDGDHLEKAARHDYEHYKRFVRPGGLIAFHDIIGSEQAIAASHHSYKVWEEAKKNCKSWVELIQDKNGLCGIGVLFL
jgi:SAM-dependent methyltransferase